MARAKPLTAVQGVQRDLAALPAQLATSGLAATAVSLARELDDPDVSATAKAACAGSLVGVLGELRELAPAGDEVDEVDELRSRREARR